MLVYVVYKQIELYNNLKKALFFHDLVNRKRVIKYFLLIDLWFLLLITNVFVAALGGIYNIKPDYKNMLNYLIDLNPLNLWLKWTLVSFEDF